MSRQREILFRAKRLDDGEMVEGYPVLRDDGSIIMHLKPMPTKGFDIPEVDPTTLCQFTGLYDKNGERIWEHDLLSHPCIHQSFELIFKSGAFGYMYLGSFHWLVNFGEDMLTRLGSVHDEEGKR